MVDLLLFLAGSIFPLAVVSLELVFAVVAATFAAIGAAVVDLSVVVVSAAAVFVCSFSSACLIWYFHFEVAGLCSLSVALTN